MRLPRPVFGDRFGRLTVLRLDEVQPESHVRFVCLCDCGKTHIVRIDHLRAGLIISCGCWHDEAARLFNLKHGHHPKGASTPEYRAWCNMNDRCYRERSGQYKNYGGRGVKVCASWRESFAAFLAYVGLRPGPGMSLDRIDPFGNYEPGNVRWATAVTQARNVRNKKYIVAFGKSFTLAEWSELTGMDRRKIHNRLAVLGWSPERAVSL